MQSTSRIKYTDNVDFQTTRACKACLKKNLQDILLSPAVLGA